MDGARREPHTVNCANQTIMEFPVTVEPIAGHAMCFFGGGYLRLFPYFVTRRMSSSVLKSGRPVFFYIHPREVDPGHPRLPMSAKRRFKSYVNLRTTEPKVRRILKEFTFSTFEQLLAAQQARATDVPGKLNASAVHDNPSEAFATRGEA